MLEQKLEAMNKISVNFIFDVGKQFVFKNYYETNGLQRGFSEG